MITHTEACLRSQEVQFETVGRLGACICGADKVDHPAHYGGADNQYEAIKVIDAWGVSFSLGNTLKYICRAGKKPQRYDTTTMGATVKTYVEGTPKSTLEDLKKARWYLDHEIERLEIADARV